MVTNSLHSLLHLRYSRSTQGADAARLMPRLRRALQAAFGIYCGWGVLRRQDLFPSPKVRFLELRLEEYCTGFYVNTCSNMM